MLKKLLCITLIACFFTTSISVIPAKAGILLPEPGTIVNLSPAYNPVMIKGLTVHQDDPFLFDFIVDVGQDKMTGEPLKAEGEKLIKYFLASLAIPEKDFWVNLSPYEKDRIVPDALGQTELGRDLLSQDYMLKQITASLIYPETKLGQSFWDKVYAKAQAQFGTTEIPVNTFNKVWIMADRAEVFERNQTAFVVDSHLKVMLESDYLAQEKNKALTGSAGAQTPTGPVPAAPYQSSELGKLALPVGRAPASGPPVASTTSSNVSAQIIREIILPELEKEINTGKNFANLRQIFNSIILSSWYKKNLKQALLNQVYADQSKVNGINLDDPTIKQHIYDQYLKAYKKGVFNYIKEDINQQTHVPTPKKYFSGGIGKGVAGPKDFALTSDPRKLDRALTSSELVVMNARMDNAMRVTIPAEFNETLFERGLTSILREVLRAKPTLIDDLEALFREYQMQVSSLQDPDLRQLALKTFELESALEKQLQELSDIHKIPLLMIRKDGQSAHLPYLKHTGQNILGFDINLSALGELSVGLRRVLDITEIYGLSQLVNTPIKLEAIRGFGKVKKEEIITKLTAYAKAHNLDVRRWSTRFLDVLNFVSETLMREGITTLGQLAEKTPEQLKSIKVFTSRQKIDDTAIKNIQEELAQWGLGLKEAAMNGEPDRTMIVRNSANQTFTEAVDVKDVETFISRINDPRYSWLLKPAEWTAERIGLLEGSWTEDMRGLGVRKLSETWPTYLSEVQKHQIINDLNAHLRRLFDSRHATLNPIDYYKIEGSFQRRVRISGKSEIVYLLDLYTHSPAEFYALLKKIAVEIAASQSRLKIRSSRAWMRDPEKRSIEQARGVVADNLKILAAIHYLFQQWAHSSPDTGGVITAILDSTVFRSDTDAPGKEVSYGFVITNVNAAEFEFTLDIEGSPHTGTLQFRRDAAGFLEFLGPSKQWRKLSKEGYMFPIKHKRGGKEIFRLYLNNNNVGVSPIEGTSPITFTIRHKNPSSSSAIPSTSNDAAGKNEAMVIDLRTFKQVNALIDDAKNQVQVLEKKKKVGNGFEFFEQVFIDISVIIDEVLKRGNKQLSDDEYQEFMRQYLQALYENQYIVEMYSFSRVEIVKRTPKTDLSEDKLWDIFSRTIAAQWPGKTSLINRDEEWRKKLLPAIRQIIFAGFDIAIVPLDSNSPLTIETLDIRPGHLTAVRENPVERYRYMWEEPKLDHDGVPAGDAGLPGHDLAMRIDVLKSVQQTHGGIDLDTSKGMNWQINKEGQGVTMTVDPAMIERIKRDGIDFLKPVIFNVTPLSTNNVWPLLGLEAPRNSELLASGRRVE